MCGFNCFLNFCSIGIYSSLDCCITVSSYSSPSKFSREVMVQMLVMQQYYNQDFLHKYRSIREFMIDISFLFVCNFCKYAFEKYQRYFCNGVHDRKNKKISSN